MSSETYPCQIQIPAMIPQTKERGMNIPVVHAGRLCRSGMSRVRTQYCLYSLNPHMHPLSVSDCGKGKQGTHHIAHWKRELPSIIFLSTFHSAKIAMPTHQGIPQCPADWESRMSSSRVWFIPRLDVRVDGKKEQKHIPVIRQTFLDGVTIAFVRRRSRPWT